MNCPIAVVHCRMKWLYTFIYSSPFHWADTKSAGRPRFYNSGIGSVDWAAAQAKKECGQPCPRNFSRLRFAHLHCANVLNTHNEGRTSPLKVVKRWYPNAVHIKPLGNQSGDSSCKWKREREKAQQITR